MKILMATMGLDIGGAETHIVELAKQLRKEGHDVCVASNGGVFVSELEQAGIRHEKVPMHRRNIFCMLRSLVLLRRLIRRERPDIVHAHARIPAFLCGVLHRTMGFPFVTTDHGVFDTSGILKYVSHWGEKTLAVSEDIKDYLMDNYSVPAEDIIVTVNGIDTEKFSPSVSGASVASELGLDPDHPILTHVSRLDDRSALVARQLIDLAEALDRAVPGVQLVIVGGGSLLGKLRARADRVNQALGRRCVILTGPRTDVNLILAVSQVFVGVSRAALEAMAAACPVIVAGTAGYIGVFDETQLSLAKNTNFCCRGCPPSTGDRLLADLTRVFRDMDEDRRQALGAYGRQVVLDLYSVRRMTQDTLAAYRAALPPKYKVVVCGYYGYANAGDEALLTAIRRNLAALEQNISVTVLSNDPEATRRQYGCQAVHRFRLGQVLSALRRCDLLLFGGGSLLQDQTSTRSLVYYVSVVRLAERMGKKVMFYANGIGPIQKPSNRRRVCRAAMAADCLTLRDESSAQTLRSMGAERDDLHVTADPVFTLDPAPAEHAQALLRQIGVPQDRPFLAVSVRDWPGMDDLAPKLARCLDQLSRSHHKSVVFVVMQHPHDVAVSRRVQSLMTEPAWLLDSPLRPEELMAVIGQAELTISMRLHALIFSARMGVPLVGLVYDAKVEYYLKLLDMPSGGPVSGLREEELLARTEDLLARRDECAARLAERSARLAKAARQNEDYLLKLLEQK
jgi:polysaccharide pyruvyl transferase CsaB